MPSNGYFTAETFEFLSELAANNDREWFTANRDRYEGAIRAPALRLIRDFAAPLAELSPYFQSTPQSLYRIHRDTRFSRDKSPYKTHAGIHFRHVNAKDAHTPGYYLHLEPGGVFIGLGIWRPDPPILRAIRDHMVEKPTAWRRAARDKQFRSTFELRGERLSRPPQGYDPAHPLVDDLRYKDFIAARPLSETVVARSDLPVELARVWSTGTAFMRFLCDAVGAPFR